MRIGVFTLPDVLKEQNPNMVINDRYPFRDGRLELVEPVAVQVERTLCMMYECKLEWISAEPVRDMDAPTGSLAKVITQPGAQKVAPPTESKTAANAIVQPQPVDGPKSVTPNSVEDGAKAAEVLKAEAQPADPAPVSTDKK